MGAKRLHVSDLPPESINEWRAINPFSRKSPCGRYAVSKSAVNGSWRYLAWLRGAIKPGGKYRAVPECLGDADTANDAVAICRNHAKQEAREAQ